MILRLYLADFPAFISRFFPTSYRKGKEKEKLAELTYIPHLAAFHLKRISKPIHFPGNVRANPATLPPPAGNIQIRPPSREYAGSFLYAGKARYLSSSSSSSASSSFTTSSSTTTFSTTTASPSSARRLRVDRTQLHPRVESKRTRTRFMRMRSCAHVPGCE